MTTHTGEADCPFCEIIRNEDTDVREIYRDENVVAFFPIEPAVLGHTLVVPKEHFEDIWSLPETVAAALARASLRISRVVREAVAAEGLNIIQSNGAVATQTIFHLHVHIVPRHRGDKMGRIWQEDTDFDESEKDQTQASIRKLLQEGGGCD